MEDDYGRVQAAMEHFVDEVIPDIWLSWLWFRRYVLSKVRGLSATGGEPLMIDGHNWRVTRAELPLALRDLDATDPT